MNKGSISPTRTTNRLHFSDLEPTRFEEICYMLLSNMFKWKKLDHLGKLGADDGIDIRGTLATPAGDKVWVIQCKRYLKITPAELQMIVDKIIDKNSMPDKILLVLSCDVSKRNVDKIEKYCSLRNVPEIEIWQAITLETHLYAHPKVLSIAFGLNRDKETKASIAKLNRGLKMKEKLLKAIIDYKYLKDPGNRQTLIDYPSSKFISDEVYIRSVDDTTYGTGETTPKGIFNTSFRTFFYDTYHNGLEFWLSPGIGKYVIMGENGYWEPIWDKEDVRLQNGLYKAIEVKAIGRIPYHRIINFIKDGDEFTSCPHLFCLFDGEDGMPYEEIYFKFPGNPQKGGFDWPLDKRKRTIFSRGY